MRSIAAAQTTPIRGDVDANIRQHIELARVAAADDVQIVAFPELSLTGYELDLAAALAFTVPDRRLAPLRRVAAETGTTLIVGAPVRDSTASGGKPHLAALIIAPQRPIGLVTKHHLGAFSADANPGGAVPPAESTVFQGGDLAPLVRFGDHAAVVAICADATRPAHPLQAVSRGADTYLASVFVPKADVGEEAQRLRGYAAQYGLAVAMANVGGPSGGVAGGGRSAIWSACGAELVRLDDDGAGVAIAAEEGATWRTRAVMLDRR